MPLGIGPLELVIVLVIVIVIFGVGKLPDVGGALGKGIREFRTSVREEPEPGRGEAGSGEGRAGSEGRA